MTIDASDRARVLVEALPYIKRFHGQKVVIKLGGHAMERKDETLLDIVLLRYVGLLPVLVHGGDPNWGRIVCALGYSGADLAIDRLDLSIAGLTVFTRGAGQPVDLAAVRTAFEQPEIMIHAELGLGDGSAEAWGCDLSEEYVRINADYTT